MRSDGSHRFLAYTRDFGLSSTPRSGVFYTDPYGRVDRQPGEAGALRQYLKPEVSFTVTYPGDNNACVARVGYGSVFWTTYQRLANDSGDIVNGNRAALEGAIRMPN